MGARRVAIVGHCAAGKSTLAAALREHGVDAWVVGQEHSGIARLWDRRSPEVLVYLDVSLDGIRTRRRDPRWPKWLYDVQDERLADARRNAAIVVVTDGRTAADVVEQVVAALTG